MLTVQSEGERLLLGVETKYTEPFSQRRYAKDSYQRVCDSAGSWFLPDAAEVAQTPVTNQLWRNTMLAQEAARDEGCEGAVIVLSAAGDPGATAAVAGLRPLLHRS